MNAKTIAFLVATIAAFISISTPAYAQQRAFVEFETCFDLEGSRVAEDNDHDCLPTGDILFAFNGEKTTPTVLFWNELVANVVLLPGVPFAAVNASILDHPLRFAEHLNEFPDQNFDVPFTGTDTALVLTDRGRIFKVGFAICMTNQSGLYPGCAALDPVDVDSLGVQFQYARLR